MAYKNLIEAFLDINSKYRNSWECSVLLVKLGLLSWVVEVVEAMEAK